MKEQLKKIMRYAAPYHYPDALSQLDRLIGMGAGIIHVNFHQSAMELFEWRGLHTHHPPHPFNLHDKGPAMDNMMRDFTSICKENGIIPMVYICFHTFAIRLLNDHPEAWDWLATDEMGTPLLQALYVRNRQRRYQGCPNNPGWIDHLKAMSSQAVNLGFKGIFFDNPNWVWCYCPHCQEAFGTYLKGKGFDPEPVPKTPDWKSETWQQYMRFLGSVIKEKMTELNRFLKQQDPEFIITMNSLPPTERSPSVQAVLSYYVNEAADYTFYEIGAGRPSGQLGNGKYWKGIDYRSYGVAEGELYGKLLTILVHRKYRDPEEDTRPKTVPSVPYGNYDKFDLNRSRLGLAEGWAFRSSEVLEDIHSIRNFERPMELRSYYDFAQEHADLYIDSKMKASVGVYFSMENLMRNLAVEHTNDDPDLAFFLGKKEGKWPHPGYLKWINILADSHLPFKTILDLETCDVDVLIIPDTKHITPEESAALEKKIKEGLKILATGETSLYEGSKRLGGYQLSRVYGTEEPVNTRIRNDYGKGAAVLLPDAPEMKYYIPQTEDKDGVTDAGQNSCIREVLISELRSLYGKKQFPVEGRMPQSLLLTALEYRGKTCINMVNYGVSIRNDQVIPAGEASILLDTQPEKAEIYSPDRKKPEIELIKTGVTAEIRVSRTGIYNLIVLS
ncbi:MAG: hypothetical protein ACLFSE_00385 [Spirochaetia bacterium]